MTSEERFIKIENALRTVSENQAQREAAIQDLIIVSRTFLESQKETNQIQGLAVDHQELKADLKQLAASQRELTETSGSCAMNSIARWRNGRSFQPTLNKNSTR